MRIGILGGTGPAGSPGRSTRLGGLRVRDRLPLEVRAMETVDGFLEKEWPDLHLDHGGDRRAADADLVVIATPWDGATQTAALGARPAAGQGRDLDGQRPHQGRQGVPAARAPRGSVAASVQAAVPRSLVAAASTTCRPRSSATSTTRSRATC